MNSTENIDSFERDLFVIMGSYSVYETAWAEALETDSYAFDTS